MATAKKTPAKKKPAPPKRRFLAQWAVRTTDGLDVPVGGTVTEDQVEDFENRLRAGMLVELPAEGN